MKKNYAILMAGVILLSGCGSKGGSAYDSSEATTDYHSYQTVNAAGGAYMTDSADMYEGAIEFEEDYERTEDIDPALTSEKLVYTGSLTVQTLQYEDTLNSIRSYIRENGGIVEYEYEYDTNYNWYSINDTHTGTRHINLTLRIPTEKFDTFMNGMDGYGKVTSRSSSVENITKRYNDVSVQIEALEIQQTRLLEMMDMAQTIEDMIMVEQRLTEVQTQLNSYKTQRESMDTDVAYSTISLSVDEVREYSDTHPNFIQQIGAAFSDGFRSFVYHFEDLLITLIYLLPYLVILGIIIYVLVKKQVFKNFHPFRRRKKKVFEEPKEDKEIL